VPGFVLFEARSPGQQLLSDRYEPDLARLVQGAKGPPERGDRLFAFYGYLHRTGPRDTVICNAVQVDL
jgi:hypothetical protein